MTQLVYWWSKLAQPNDPPSPLSSGQSGIANLIFLAGMPIAYGSVQRASMRVRQGDPASYEPNNEPLLHVLASCPALTVRLWNDRG
jgi:hypothetical protein